MSHIIEIFKLKKLFESFLLWILLLLLVLFFSIATGGLFISPRNILNILVQSTLTGVVAIGMTFVILTGGIDLSVSGIVMFTSILGAILMAKGYSWAFVIAAMLSTGIIFGMLNGIAVTKFKMVPFVTTLAVLNITRGLGKLISNGQSIFIPTQIHSFFGQGKIFGLPVTIIILALALLSAAVSLRYTRFGRKIYSVGGNTKAAWLAGIRTDRIILIAYIISGFCAAWGAILITSRLMSASSLIAQGLELDAIAACVIGGTSLFGGEGDVIGTVLGAILISIINIGLNLMGVSPFIQEIVKGLIIFFVIAIDASKTRNAL